MERVRLENQVDTLAFDLLMTRRGITRGRVRLFALAMGLQLREEK